MTGANVARAMQLSAPTVHEMVGRLERDGYITRAADKSISFTDDGREHAEARRPPPPADRALPDRRAEDPVGRRARGGRAARARDVAGARGAHAGRDRRRQDLPARPPDPAGRRGSRASRSATPSWAPRSRSCASRTRPRTCCTCSRREGLEPGREGVVAEVDDEHITVDFGGETATLTRSVAETVSVLADPSPPPRIALPEQLVLAKDRYGRERWPGGGPAGSGDAGAACVRGDLAARRRRSSRAAIAAQAVERVPDVDEARVERGDAEPDRVRAAEVGDDVRALDQRAGDRPGLAGGAATTCEPRRGGVARRAERRSRAARATRRGARSAARSGRSTSRGSRSMPASAVSRAPSSTAASARIGGVPARKRADARARARTARSIANCSLWPNQPWIGVRSAS